MNDKRQNDSNVIMPDEVRPALADMVSDDTDDGEISGQDLYEDETVSGHVLRPTDDI